MEVNGIPYHVNTVGDGAHHLLLLHGFTGCGANFTELIKDFPKKENFTFILVDLLGHGQTSTPLHADRYQMKETVADLYTILEILNVEKCSLFGYSMGGRVALSFALQYPEIVQRLILESASPGLKKESDRHSRQKADEQLAQFILTKGIGEFVDYWTEIPLFQSQKTLAAEKQQKIYQQRLNNTPLGLANSLKGIGTGVQPSYWEKISMLTMPVLLAAGEGDAKFVQIAQEMSKQIENARFIKINDAGHAIHVEQPRKFGKIVSEFLSN